MPYVLIRLSSGSGGCGEAVVRFSASLSPIVATHGPIVYRIQVFANGLPGRSRRTYARDRHQPAAGLVGAHQLKHHPVQPVEGRQQRCFALFQRERGKMAHDIAWLLKSL